MLNSEELFAAFWSGTLAINDANLLHELHERLLDIDQLSIIVANNKAAAWNNDSCNSCDNLRLEVEARKIFEMPVLFYFLFQVFHFSN